LLKQYSDKIKLFSFVSSHSAPAISSIFNLKLEIQTGTVRDLNRAENKFSTLLN
jgi:hypothetical protein